MKAKYPFDFQGVITQARNRLTPQSALVVIAPTRQRETLRMAWENCSSSGAPRCRIRRPMTWNFRFHPDYCGRGDKSAERDSAGRYNP